MFVSFPPSSKTDILANLILKAYSALLKMAALKKLHPITGIIYLILPWKFFDSTFKKPESKIYQVRLIGLAFG